MYSYKFIIYYFIVFNEAVKIFYGYIEREKINIFNDALNMFFIYSDITSDIRLKREKEMFYLTTHSTHFIYGYMASAYTVKNH